MTRGAAFVLLMTTGCVCFFALTGSAPPPSHAPAERPGTVSPAAHEAPSVRIEHQLIEVPVPAAPIVRKVAVQPVRRVRLTESYRDKPSFALNARKILLGDGRYRPQPFPKP